jgi:hypothetical protein
VQPEQHRVGQALGQIRLKGFVGEHCPHMQSPGHHVHCGRGWTPGGSSPRSTARRTTVSANANRDAQYRSRVAATSGFHSYEDFQAANRAADVLHDRAMLLGYNVGFNFAGELGRPPEVSFWV